MVLKFSEQQLIYQLIKLIIINKFIINQKLIIINKFIINQ